MKGAIAIGLIIGGIVLLGKAIIWVIKQIFNNNDHDNNMSTT